MSATTTSTAIGNHTLMKRGHACNAHTFFYIRMYDLVCPNLHVFVGERVVKISNARTQNNIDHDMRLKPTCIDACFGVYGHGSRVICCRFVVSGFTAGVRCRAIRENYCLFESRSLLSCEHGYSVCAWTGCRSPPKRMTEPACLADPHVLERRRTK